MTHPFAAAPFYLDADALSWVDATLNSLSTDDKLRQLFTLICPAHMPEALEAARAFRPGGITRMAIQSPPAEEAAALAALSAAMPTPLLVSADLEGSRMSLAHGAEWPNPLALAAIDAPEQTRRASVQMAREARATGICWSFTPVLDINAAFRSAIVATRGFGSDPATIESHAIAQLEAFQSEGVASAVKHFPGEGFDDRDQHLVTTINPLSLEDWERAFGTLYRAAIKAGALSVMSAHIAFPAFARAHGATGIEAFRPASINPILNQKLLREHLGFGGLIVSDATPMAGLTSWSPRAEHLPEVISSGCDVILFLDAPETDLAHLHTALADGRLTISRVDDAVSRQLALKAHLGLHHTAAQTPTPPNTERNAALAKELALAAPTLVKDVPHTLPLSPQTHRRVLVFSGDITIPFLPQPLPFALPEMLAQNGFEITPYTPGMGINPADFDLILYLFGDETLLTRGRIFFDWLKLTGSFNAAMERHWHEIPSVMISFGYPYMLYDAPRMPTVINAYNTTETTQAAVVELLLGKADWNRNSPVDPFCGLEDARY